MSQTMSQVRAPITFDLPRGLHAIRENGDVMGLPFAFQKIKWITKPAEKIRDRLLGLESKEEVAAFLTFAGYVAMLDEKVASVADGVIDLRTRTITSTRPVYPIKPGQISDKLMAYVMEWKDACREILTKFYRYPEKPQHESPLGRGSVRELARRGTGRFSAIPIDFTWDESGEPKLTIRPQTTLESAVLACHLARMSGSRFRQCHRHDCGKIFELKTKHAKIYCSYACAHLEVVRRGRKKSQRRPK